MVKVAGHEKLIAGFRVYREESRRATHLFLFVANNCCFGALLKRNFRKVRRRDALLTVITVTRGEMLSVSPFRRRARLLIH